MSLWLLARGNVLFGDWGRPEATRKEVAPPSLEKLASDFDSDSDDDVPTNTQHAFVQLIRDGHYLGYWSSSDERPPQLVFDNVRLAIDYRLLYPRWLFLWDFPPSQLQNLARRAGPAFVKSAQDFVVPRARMAVGENKQSDGVCALL